MDPLRHFIDAGLRERRDPNRWFDGAWYTRQYADVAASGAHPLLHYMTEGARQGRDPHPRFDAGWYVRQHPEAAGNPLLFHLRVGAMRGWLTERPVAIEALPALDQPAIPRCRVIGRGRCHHPRLSRTGVDPALHRIRAGRHRSSGWSDHHHRRPLTRAKIERVAGSHGEHRRHHAVAQQEESGVRRLGQSRHAARRRSRCRAAEQRYRGAARLAAPVAARRPMPRKKSPAFRRCRTTPRFAAGSVTRASRSRRA